MASALSIPGKFRQRESRFLSVSLAFSVRFPNGFWVLFDISFPFFPGFCLTNGWLLWFDLTSSNFQEEDLILMILCKFSSNYQEEDLFYAVYIYIYI